MPTSHHYQISQIVGLIIDINPNSILDAGVGFGKYGLLCREFLELWDDMNEYGTFKRRIDGVEVYEKYLTPVHRYIYNNIYIGNILDVIDEVDTHYDLILLIDVLEHFHTDEGKRLIKKLLQKADGVIISTPRNIGVRGEYFENEHEAHLGQWSKGMLKKFGPNYCIKNFASHIVYIGKKDKVKIIKKQATKRRVKDWLRALPFVPQIAARIRGKSGHHDGHHHH